MFLVPLFLSVIPFLSFKCAASLKPALNAGNKKCRNKQFSSIIHSSGFPPVYIPFPAGEKEMGLYRTGWSMNCNSLLQNISALGHKQCASGTYGSQVWIRKSLGLAPWRPSYAKRALCASARKNWKMVGWDFYAKRWLRMATSQAKYNQQHG